MENKAKEKAEELAIKFSSLTDVFKPNIASVRNALICVEEIIQSHIDWETEQDGCIVFWEEVRDELNKMQ